jgi:predicted deacylase
VADLVSAIESKVSALEARNYATIGENRNATQRSNALTETLTAIARGLNLEGDLDTLLDALPNAVQDVRRTRDELSAKAQGVEQQLVAAQGKVQAFERLGNLAVAERTNAHH